jgi:hypothetical protein
MAVLGALGVGEEVLKLIVLVVQELFKIHEEKRAAAIAGDKDVDKGVKDAQARTATEIMASTTDDDILAAMQRVRNLQQQDNITASGGADPGGGDRPGESGKPT